MISGVGLKEELAAGEQVVTGLPLTVVVVQVVMPEL
jgi:hypothetical protein